MFDYLVEMNRKKIVKKTTKKKIKKKRMRDIKKYKITILACEQRIEMENRRKKNCERTSKRRKEKSEIPSFISTLPESCFAGWLGFM